MAGLIKRCLSPIGAWATKIESWLALVFMISSWGFFTWLGNQWAGLASHGWAAVMFFALGVTLLVIIVASIFLFAWRYFRPLPHQFSPYDPWAYSQDPASGAPSREVYFSLFDFAVQHLWPACDRQIDLQKAIIREGAGDDFVKELAIEGMSSDTRPASQAFWVQYENLVQGIEGCEPTLNFDALVDCINRLGKGAYKDFCDQSEEMGKRAKISELRSHRVLGPVWWEWANQHNQLVDEHKKVTQNPRFGRKVYRPNKPGN